MELAWLIASALFRPPHYLHSQLWCFLWELVFNNVCFASIFTPSCWSVYQKHFLLEDAFQDFNWGNLFVPRLHNKPHKMLSLNELGHCNACTHRVILICLGQPTLAWATALVSLSLIYPSWTGLFTGSLCWKFTAGGHSPFLASLAALSLNCSLVFYPINTTLMLLSFHGAPNLLSTYWCLTAGIAFCVAIYTY